jgi:hypothetical protein
MAVFGEEDRRAMRAQIDRHLIDQIDYRLVDYHLASASYRELIEAVYALDPSTRQQEVVYKELVKMGMDMTTYRALIEAAVGQAMSPLEWSGLSLLLLVLLGLISVLPGGTALGALVAGVLAGTLTTLMILLRQLDLLRWHERVTIWEPTTRLFRNMGHHPYVPRLVIDDDRYRPTGVVRVVDYPDPYPNRSTKVVTVVDLGDDPALYDPFGGTTGDHGRGAGAGPGRRLTRAAGQPSNEMGTMAEADGASEPPWLTTITQPGWLASQTPEPTAPVLTVKGRLPEPLGSGSRMSARPAVRSQSVACVGGLFEHSRMLTDTPGA